MRLIRLGVAIILILFLLAATGPEPTITDPCGSDTFPHLDICEATISPEFSIAGDNSDEATLMGLEVTMDVDGSIEDRRPTDTYAVVWTLADCVYVLSADPRPTPGDPARLLGFLQAICDDGSNEVWELTEPDVDEHRLTWQVSVVELRTAGPGYEVGAVLERVEAMTHMGSTKNSNGVADVLYEWDVAGGDGQEALEPEQDR